VFIGDIGLELVLAVFVTGEDGLEVGGGHGKNDLDTDFIDESE